MIFHCRLPSWLSGKEFACQCRRHGRHGFNPWIRKWQSTPVFSPGESHGQRSQHVGLQSVGSQKSQTRLNDQTTKNKRCRVKSKKGHGEINSLLLSTRKAVMKDLRSITGRYNQPVQQKGINFSLQN